MRARNTINTTKLVRILAGTTTLVVVCIVASTRVCSTTTLEVYTLASIL